MSDFKVIETQEDFDKAIQKRLAQKDRELEEQYKDVYDEKQFTEILFAVGRVSVDILEMYLALPEDQKRSYRYDFKSLLMTREFPAH